MIVILEGPDGVGKTTLANTFKEILPLIKQMFNYGKYKPLVLSRNIDRIRIRHIIPAVFTLYLVSLLFFTNIITLIPIILYLIIKFKIF